MTIILKLTWKQFVYYLKYVRLTIICINCLRYICLTFMYVYIICVDHVRLLSFLLQLEISRTASSVQGEC